MYIPLLIRKYLARRRIAWASLVAVALCTAMVLVVLSVMGGWLDMFRASFKGLSGDVVVRSTTLLGFPGYEEMIAELEKLPEVKAAVPVVQTYGLINIQDGNIFKGVDVVGYPMDRIGLVNGFPASLYLNAEVFGELANGTVVVDYNLQVWLLEQAKRDDITDLQREALRQAAKDLAELTDAQRAALRKLPRTEPDTTLPMPASAYRQVLANLYERGRTDPAALPGMFAGAKLVFTVDENGSLPRGAGVYKADVKLTVLELKDGATDVSAENISAPERFFIADDSLTGVHARDANSVYVDFDRAQELAGMQGTTEIDAETGEEIRDPARTTELQVALTPGMDLMEGRKLVNDVIKRVAARQETDMPQLDVLTWEQVTGGLIAQVEKETVLVTFLMSMISLVAVVLIFCIFYMIVVEKTKDIGILKSVGATGRGVALIFIGYGAAIGVVGGLAGLLVGSLVVWNINTIHDLMGSLLEVQVWDPQFYLFDTVPNEVSLTVALSVLTCAVLASIVGSVLPAIRAARLRPVEALRFE